MPLGRIYEVAERQREAILAGERAAASQLVETFGGMWQRIRREIDDLLEKRAAAEAAGEVIGPEWLWKQNRLETLLAQVERELRIYAEFASPLVTNAQGQAVDMALWHSEELVRAATRQVGIAVNWNRLPVDALNSLIGFTADGSPLRELLERMGPEVAGLIRDGLIQGVALGHNPERIAGQLRNYFARGLSQALTVCRTEAMRAYREGSYQSALENDDILDGWMWNSACTPRTCFPVGTLIQTRHGQVPIENVLVGDEVLTHTGQYHRVRETLQRQFVGSMVTVRADGFEVTATSDHPLLVQRQGKLNWVEAGNLSLGDTVFCYAESSADIRKHGFGESSIQRCRDQTNYSIPTRLKKEVSLPVTSSYFVMPVGFINFKNGIRLRYEKISRVVSNLKFLGKVDAKMGKTDTSVAFRFGRSLEYLAAVFAGVFTSWRGRLSATTMRMLALVKSVAGFRAKTTTAFLDPGSRDRENVSTNFTSAFDPLIETLTHGLFSTSSTAISGFLSLPVANVNPGISATDNTYSLEFASVTLDFKSFHTAIVSQITNHVQPDITVYNLEIDEDHSYTANGFVVHNCAACWTMHGTTHPLTERLEDHVCGRCTQYWLVKQLPGMRPQWRPESGAAQFARLDPHVQRNILGPGKFEAYRAGVLRLEDVAGYSHSADWGRTLRVKSLKEMVGEEHAKEFAAWGKAQYGGDAAILREAQRIAERHGVIAQYEGDVNVAQLVTDGILKLNRDEWLPGQVSVDADWFGENERERVVARFMPHERTLLINPQQEYWRFTFIERRKEIAFWRAERQTSSDHILHPVFHEFGHAAWARMSPLLYAKYRGDLANEYFLTALEVSTQAIGSGSEFVAEVFAGMMAGVKYDGAVLSLYRLFGGPFP